jgi:predicted TIM-barrel fold metal-dependent hydrolase
MPTALRHYSESLHQQGVRGVRLNVEAGSADAVSISAALRQTAEKVAPLGWLIQLYADGATVAALAPMLATLPAASFSTISAE